MPSITLNKKVVEELIGKKLPIEEFKNRISMLGTDLEKIEGDEIHVEIFPNRPDLLSEQGFARALASFIGKKTGLRKYNVKKSNKKIIVDKSVSMRQYTACAIVKNVKFNDERIREIMQIQEKLATTHGRNRKKSAYGLYPADKIAFPVHYIAKDPKTIQFWPLGLPKPIRADDVEELHPKGQEYKWIAKDWKKYPFFIDNKNNVMCMLPYTNSHDTGKVDEYTKEVFIECTGVDFNNVSVALNIFVTMLADMGGEIYSVEIQYPGKKVVTPNLNPTKMKIELSYINRVLGLTLKETQMKTLLERMGFGYQKKTVLIPSWRSDILHQIDLVEDIAIAYGYEHFRETIPNVATVGEETKIEVLKTKISEVLTGLQIQEVMTYNISNNEIQQKRMGIPEPSLELANALSEECTSLRSWMIPSLLQVLEQNRHNEYPQNLFDIGSVFGKSTSTDTGVKEHIRLAVLLCNDKADFTGIKQVLDYIFSSINKSYSLDEVEHASFISGRVGRVVCEGKKIAYVGEISPAVLENFSLQIPVAALELNLTELLGVLSIDKKQM